MHAHKGGITPDIPSAAALGSSIENKLLVKAGNAGMSIAAIGFDTWMGSGVAPTMGGGTSANCQIVPLGSWGGIWLNGDYLGDVQQGVEISLQVSKGDQLFCPAGMSGVYAIGRDAWQPLMHTGFGGKEFSVYVFRQYSQQGKIAMLCGDQESEVVITNSSGTELFKETFEALESKDFTIPAVGEYRITASADISVAKHHGTTVNAYDSGVVFPAVSEPIIGWCRYGQVSSYDSETSGVEIFVRDGVTGSGTVGYGSPFDINAFGADTYLAPNGAAIIYPQSRVACYAGADSNGGELAPWQVVSWLPNVVGIPCSSNNKNLVSISSAFEGSYLIKDSSSTLATRTLTRINTTDQRHPSADRFDTGTIAGNPSLLVSTVPINVVINLPEPDRFYNDPASGSWAEETVIFGKRSEGFQMPHRDPITDEYYIHDLPSNTVTRA